VVDSIMVGFESDPPEFGTTSSTNLQPSMTAPLTIGHNWGMTLVSCNELICVEGDSDISKFITSS